MSKEKILNEVFKEYLGLNVICHGFEVKSYGVELWTITDGFKYGEIAIPLEVFHRTLENYFNQQD